jgi:hypothetical protein
MLLVLTLLGNIADIPAEATWQIKESGMGTIENGIFVSNGTTGTVTAQMVYDNKVVGEASIEIVIPEIAFTTSTFSVKYGTTADLTVVATTNNGVNEVVLKPSDYTITCSNAAIGTISGSTFTAVDEANAPSVKDGTLTVTLNHGTGITGTARVVICKEITEVLFDFENGNMPWVATEIGGDGVYATRGVQYDISAVDSDNGFVHDGNGAMRFDSDQLSAKIINNSRTIIGLPVIPDPSFLMMFSVIWAMGIC